MFNENIKNRVFSKLENALKIYADLVYEKVGELDNTRACFTEKHLRSVAESGYEPIAPVASR